MTGVVTGNRQTPEIDRPPARRGGRVTVVVSAAVLILLLASAMVPGTGASRSPAPAMGPAISSTAFPTPIHHVFVIFMENQARSTVLAHGPFEAYLAQHYAQASHYYGVCHPSAPNYLAATSGDPLQCGTDTYQVYTTTNIVSLLTNSGISNWTGYMQSMPSACDTSNAGDYVVHHNPFLFYHNVVGNRTYCDQHVVNLSNLNASIASGTVPAFAWITPNNVDNSANSSVATADQWLKGFLSPILNDSFFRSSVFFLTYDESLKTDSSGYNGTSGGNVYFAAISPYARTGYLDTVNASHYNLLSTAEWLLGLGSTGHHDGTSQFPAMRSLFDFTSSSPPPPQYALSGLVSSTNGTVPAGTTLVWGNATTSASVPVNASGAFSTELPNGTYDFAASAPGFNSASENVTVHGGPVTGISLNLTQTTPPPAAQYLVNGSVVNASSLAPIANITVQVASATNTTTVLGTPSGSFSAERVNGTYSVMVNATGYAPLYSTWTVEGRNLSVRYLLDSPSAIGNQTNGTGPTNGSANESYPVAVKIVSEATHAVLSDLAIEVVNLANNSVVATSTDSNGLLLLNLPNGTYNLQIRSSGFAPAAIDLIVMGPDIVPLPLPLAPALLILPPPAPTSAGNPSADSVLALAVLAILLVSSVGLLGATWIVNAFPGRLWGGPQTPVRSKGPFRRRR